MAMSYRGLFGSGMFVLGTFVHVVGAEAVTREVAGFTVPAPFVCSSSSVDRHPMINNTLAATRKALWHFNRGSNSGPSVLNDTRLISRGSVGFKLYLDD